jgi:hypothetical protein
MGHAAWLRRRLAYLQGHPLGCWPLAALPALPVVPEFVLQLNCVPCFDLKLRVHIVCFAQNYSGAAGHEL